MGSFLRNTLGPVGWIVMVAIPLAIIALYFLKLKRQPLEVPSTYLWRRVVEDLHVNSFWQKLRKSLLLLLQLLVAALAILALLRLGWQGESLEGEKFAFLIDNSASMSTTDADGGRTRLEEAKQRASMLVDQMESGMAAMIISFAHEPRVLQEFTSNRRQLRDAIERIEPTASQTDLESALRLVDGFTSRAVRQTVKHETDEAPPQKEAVRVYIFSDGRFPPVTNFSLGDLQPLFLPLGTPTAQNLAITTLSARQSESGSDQLQVFTQVANSSADEAIAMIELSVDGQLVDAMEVQIPPNEVGSTTFSLSGDSRGIVEAKLQPRADSRDQLALDNVAYSTLDDTRIARVLLVTPGNAALETALQTERASRLAKIDKLAPIEIGSPEYDAQIRTGDYQLIIYDQCVPSSMPNTNTLFVGRQPPLQSWGTGASDEIVNNPQIIDWDRTHPILNLVELGSVKIVDSLLTKPPQGGRVLIDTPQGPIMAVSPRDQFEDIAIGFEIVGATEDGHRTFNTNWPREHSFPTFWLNVLEHFSQGVREQQVHRPGEMVELRIALSEESTEMRLPDGSRIAVEVGNDGKLVFHETDRLGTYQVIQGGNPVRSFSVNLFDRNESDVRLRISEADREGIAVVDSISIGYADVVARSPNADIRKELWKGLLILALVVLLFEWYIYNRRIYI